MFALFSCFVAGAQSHVPSWAQETQQANWCCPHNYPKAFTAASAAVLGLVQNSENSPRPLQSKPGAICENAAGLTFLQRLADGWKLGSTRHVANLCQTDIWQFVPTRHVANMETAWQVATVCLDQSHSHREMWIVEVIVGRAAGAFIVTA